MNSNREIRVPRTALQAFALILMLLSIGTSFSQVSLDELQVEYRTTPLGLDEAVPRFSWQMHVAGNARDYAQEAFQLVVRDEAGIEVWNSGKVENGTALAIPYEGSTLNPFTRYHWQVTVWNQAGASTSNDSWFETGLMDSDPAGSGWRGAQWIGGGPKDMILYSHYLSVFKLDFGLQLDEASASTKASIVLGANDTRLMHRDLNIQGVANDHDDSYIRFELDISQLAPDTDAGAQLHVYRVGYTKEDSDTVPFRSFAIPGTLLNDSNKYEPHKVYIESNFGIFQAFLDGTGPEHLVSKNDNAGNPFADPGFNLNPVGAGNNFISFPMLADIGFQVNQGQSAYFSGFSINNYREPSNTLLAETPVEEARYEGIFADLARTENNGLSISQKGFFLRADEKALLFTADPSRNATPMLRTDVRLEDKVIAKARIYCTARGIYELHINGERVSEDYFTPGLTQYNKNLQYQTYDITAMLRSGAENTIGAWLSEGWWSGNITYSGENWNFFGDRPSFRALVLVTYTDGSEQWLSSKADDWKLFTEGPLRYGSFFQGEVYDANREAAISGWASPSFDDSNWKQAVEVPLAGTTYPDLDFSQMKLISQIGNSPEVVKTLTALEVREIRPGVYVYDMGQNMVGVPQIRIKNGVKGDTLIMRYAEVRYPDLPEYEGLAGMIMLENIRAALAQDIYVMKGGAETIQPRFTFHGFRFLEITGIGSALPLENVKARVISSVPQLASGYETSDPLVNKLWENISWSLRGNFLSIPTDTPARNERMGWSGDINVFSEAATYMAAADPFLNRHLLAMRDIQREDGRFTDVAPVGGGFGGTLWGSAGIVIPWELYLQYGDKRVLELHYDAMQRYIAFLESKTNPETGRLDEGPLGDWLSPEGSRNDNTLLWTAYQVHDLEIIGNTAAVLGKTADAARYRKRYNERRDYFNTTYVDAATGKTIHSGYEGRMFGPPPPGYKKPEAGSPVDTQASYAIPLHFGVFEKSVTADAVDNLTAAVSRENRDDLGVVRPPYSLMTGFIGTASLNPALSGAGKDGYAYRLLQQQSYPSWLYSVVNGATTIWERLNSYTREDGFGGNNSMNSFNHYSFGAVAAWMYNYSLGIQRDIKSPAFKHFILRPTPDPDGVMTWAKGYYDSMYGRISSSWKQEGNVVIYNLTVPPNTTATLYLKAASVKAIKESGKPLKRAAGISEVAATDGEVEMQLGSGAYEFRVE